MVRMVDEKMSNDRRLSEKALGCLGNYANNENDHRSRKKLIVRPTPPQIRHWYGVPQVDIRESSEQHVWHSNLAALGHTSLCFELIRRPQYLRHET